MFSKSELAVIKDAMITDRAERRAEIEQEENPNVKEYLTEQYRKTGPVFFKVVRLYHDLEVG